MYKKIPHENLAQALIEVIQLSNIESIAKKYNISKDTIQRKYKIILLFIPLLIRLTPKKIMSALKFFNQLISPFLCPVCGSPHVLKNGKLTLVNWAKRFLKKIIPAISNDKEIVQRFICNNCGASILSEEHIALKKIRVTVKIFVNKLICLLRFDEGLSLRSISNILNFAYGINSSLGYLSKFTNVIGQKAANKIKKLSLCKAAKKSIVAMIDETFPKIFFMTVSLCLVVDEYGLIRAVDCTKSSLSSIKGILFQCIGTSFRPLFMLGDFHPFYAKVAKQLNLVRLTDFVHAVRHIYKLVRTYIGKVNLNPDGKKKLKPKKRKELLKLKKKLLRKQVMPIIRTLFKGFKKEYRSVGTIYISGALAELERLKEKFSSLNSLYKSINKFIQKYVNLWGYQMILDKFNLAPATSNLIESKNSILRTFSDRIKAFPSRASLVRFFSAVALWENFDVKKRGSYKGTSAIQREGIDLEDFGAGNFFEAVELENSTQQFLKKINSNKIIIHLFRQILIQAA